MNHYKGECLCGACRYVITGQSQKQCTYAIVADVEKETGTIHGANVFFNDAQLLWEKGNEKVTYFKLKSTRHEHAFCKDCGSPLPMPMSGKNGQIVLPAGTLDDDSFLQPTAHIFYASRSSWEDKVMDLKKFDELPRLE